MRQEMSMGFEYTAERAAFNTVFSKQGGTRARDIFDIFEGKEDMLDEQLNNIRSLVKTTIEGRQIKNAPTIYIDYIENSTIGASVSKKDDTYYIGINTGSFYILQNIFYRMLAAPDILTKFGNTTNENQEYKLYNPNIIKYEQLITQDVNDFVVPIDQKRFNIANILLQVALSYLVLHELGHILNGHIDYLRSEGILAWDENDDIPQALSDIEQIQVLEYDADCFGWNNTINWLCGLYIHTEDGKIADNSASTSLEESLADTLGLAVFAIYTTFRVFDRSKSFEEGLLVRKHPHPKLRKALFMLGIHSLLDLKLANGRLTQAQCTILQRALLTYVLETERAFDSLTQSSQMVSREDTRELASPAQLAEHAEIFRVRWHDVRDKILPSAYIELVPVMHL